MQKYRCKMAATPGWQSLSAQTVKKAFVDLGSGCSVWCPLPSRSVGKACSSSNFFHQESTHLVGMILGCKTPGRVYMLLINIFYLNQLKWILVFEAKSPDLPPNVIYLHWLSNEFLKSTFILLVQFLSRVINHSISAKKKKKTATAKTIWCQILLFYHFLEFQNPKLLF